MESGREQNYWPGFVDALSNVVLTLVFVLVVFVFALVITSSKVAQKATEFVEEHRQQQVTTREELAELRGDVAAATMDVGDLAMVKAELEEKLAQARTEAQASRAEIAKTQKAIDSLKQTIETQERERTPSIIVERVEIANDSKAVKSEGGQPDTAAASNAIVIVYPRGVYLMNDKAKLELGKVLDRYRAQLAGSTAELTGVMGPETFSEGRRMAYYRALDVRNFLLDRKTANKQAMTLSTRQGKGNDDGRVEIRFVRP